MNFIEAIAAQNKDLPTVMPLDFFSYLLGKSQASPTKTITGVPPFTFKSNGDNLVDWSIKGNDNVGKNLLEITATSGTYTAGGADLSYTINKTTGTITLNGTSRTDSEYYIISISYISVYGDYIISGGSEFASYRIWDITSNAYTRKTDNSGVAESFGGDSTVRMPENHSYSHRIRVAPRKTFDNVVLHLMLRPLDTSADFEPYQVGVGQHTDNGYIVPLSVNSNTVNIPIGDSPLTAGETVSKSSTGVDIPTVVGDNTISTDLYNKPEMTITYHSRR